MTEKNFTEMAKPVLAALEVRANFNPQDPFDREQLLAMAKIIGKQAELIDHQAKSLRSLAEIDRLLKQVEQATDEHRKTLWRTVAGMAAWAALMIAYYIILN